MTTKINTDGTATYSVKVPAPIDVVSDGNAYQAGGQTLVISAAVQLPIFRQDVAARIAMLDAFEDNETARVAAERDRLAAVLYADAMAAAAAADPAAPPAPAWSDLLDTDKRRYLKQAESLGARGVSAGE